MESDKGRQAKGRRRGLTLCLERLVLTEGPSSNSFGAAFLPSSVRIISERRDMAWSIYERGRVVEPSEAFRHLEPGWAVGDREAWRELRPEGEEIIPKKQTSSPEIERRRQV